MLSRVILSLVVAVVVTLGSILLGTLLVELGANIAVVAVVGSFLKEFAALIGLLAGLWYFFARTR